MIASFDKFIEYHTSSVIDVRRHLHQHPELSGTEFETTRFLSEQLARSGIPYRLGPDDRGLIVDLGSPAAEKRIALRADMDAIAVQDAKDVAYRSKVGGVMHGCGHDAHSAILLSTVKALYEVFKNNPPNHAVRAFFQPEEETATGARKMIDYGVLEGVTTIVGAHVDPHRPVGSIAIKPGVVTAHCDDVKVHVVGRGGHAARPQETIDPVEAAVNFIAGSYSVVPRCADEMHPLVLSFTTFHGGNQPNVIPDDVQITGTMRSLDEEARQRAISLIRKVGKEIENASGATINIRFGPEIPSIVADHETTEVVESICRTVLGSERVLQLEGPSMGAEDFAFYSQKIPAAFIRLGSRGEKVGSFALHNSHFDIDERALVTGVKVMTHIALNFFNY